MKIIRAHQGLDNARDFVVWRYGSPGAAPKLVEVTSDVDPLRTCERGRWRGLSVCSSRDECETWIADIAPLMLEDPEALPLACPSCKSQSGFPQILWRETDLECLFCGSTARLGIIDPADKWPRRIQCPRCGMRIKVPTTGRNRFH